MSAASQPSVYTIFNFYKGSEAKFPAQETDSKKSSAIFSTKILYSNSNPDPNPLRPVVKKEYYSCLVSAWVS